MKKIIVLVLALILVVSLAACGAKPAESNVITVGATAAPHAEILEQIKDAVKEAGYELKIVIYDDYALINPALKDGELDANYFQHTPYLDSYNTSAGADLKSAAAIHYEPLGLYANGTVDLANVPEGTTILVPVDDSNQTRALLLLAQEGLITLPTTASVATGVTLLDVVDNGGYNIVSVAADTVPAQLKNSNPGTLAVVNGNYALDSGLKVADALALEAADGDAGTTYANIIAVRKGDEASAKIQALVNALKTDAVKSYIDATYGGAVQPVF